MNTNIKNTLGGAIIIAVLAVGYAAVSGAGSLSRSIDPSSLRSFSISAEGKAVGIPDIAEFSFSVITEGGKDLAALQMENTESANNVIAFIKKEGVSEKDIRTSGYNINPRRQYYNCGDVVRAGGEVCPPPEIVGYTITQSVSVKVRDLAKAGSIVAGVVKNGANSTTGLNFRIDDPTSVQNEARAEAIEKAQEKAKAVARAAGFSLGELISINEGGYAPTPQYYATRAESFDAATTGGAAPSIQPGSEEVNVNVNLVYEIK